MSTKFHVGDIVRVSKSKTIFEKGYEAGWSLKLFRISSIMRIHGQPDKYKLTDEDGQDITGSFYEQELQRTKVDPNVYLVERMGATKKVGKKTFIEVHWLGYKQPTWEEMTPSFIKANYNRLPASSKK